MAEAEKMSEVEKLWKELLVVAAIQISVGLTASLVTTKLIIYFQVFK